MNHVALEVGDLDEALRWYGRLFDFELRGRARRMAFLDMGDQFLALAEGRRQGPDDHRHLASKIETQRIQGQPADHRHGVVHQHDLAV